MTVQHPRPETSDALHCVFMPAHVPRSASTVSLHAFQVLLLTPAKRLAWLECKRKTLPDQASLRRIAASVDEFNLESERAIASAKAKLQAEHDVLFVNAYFLDKSVWQYESWIRLEIMARLSETPTQTALATLREQISASFQDSLTAQLQALRVHLDRDVLELLQTAKSPSCELYNLLYVDGGVQRRNRLQAARAFPFLLDVLHLDSYAGIRMAIDNGQPLIPRLAAHFGISEGLVKKIGKSTLPDLPGLFNTPDFLFPLFVKTPLEKVPDDETGWNEFAGLVENISRLIEQPIFTELGRVLLIECLSNSEAKKIMTGKLWKEKYQAIKHFLHALSSITRYIFMKHCSHLEAEARSRATVPKVISHLSLRELVKISLKWNDAYREAEAFYAEQNGFFRGETWPAIIKDRFDGGQYWVEPMDSVQKLGNEGKLMRNCVASYIPDCRSGRCQIWSIRTKSAGKPVANMQTFVESVKSGTHYVLRMGQIEGINNQSVDREMLAAGEKLIRAISENQAGLQAYLKWKSRIGAVSKDDRIEFASARTVCRAIMHVVPDSIDISTLLHDLMGEDFDKGRFRQLLHDVQSIPE